MLISGNPTTGLAGALARIYPNAEFASRKTGFDLTDSQGHIKFAKLALNHDIIIINSALWKFNQTVLLDAVYKECVQESHMAYIICIGSTTDRVCKGTAWLYNAEKKALRDYCNSLSLIGVWQNAPRVSYISFGTLNNNQEKHPDRTCMDIYTAATYVKWIIDQPMHINEISIDPLQRANINE